MFSDKLSHRADLLETLARSPEEAAMFLDVVKEHCEAYGITDEVKRTEIVRRVCVLVDLSLRTRAKLILGLEANRAEDRRIEANKAILRGVAARRSKRGKTAP